MMSERRQRRKKSNKRKIIFFFCMKSLCQMFCVKLLAIGSWSGTTTTSRLRNFSENAGSSVDRLEQLWAVQLCPVAQHSVTHNNNKIDRRKTEAKTFRVDISIVRRACASKCVRVTHKCTPNFMVVWKLCGHTRDRCVSGHTFLYLRLSNFIPFWSNCFGELFVVPWYGAAVVPLNTRKVVRFLRCLNS